MGSPVLFGLRGGGGGGGHATEQDLVFSGLSLQQGIQPYSRLHYHPAALSQLELYRSTSQVRVNLNFSIFLFQFCFCLFALISVSK